MDATSEDASVPRHDSGIAERPIVNLPKAGNFQARTNARSDPNQQTEQERLQAWRKSMKAQTCKEWRYGHRCHRPNARRCRYAHHLFPAIEWRAFDKADILERCARGTECRNHSLDCRHNHAPTGSAGDRYRMRLREYVRSLPYTAITCVLCNACGKMDFDIEDMLDHLETEHPESYGRYNHYSDLCPPPRLPEDGPDERVDPTQAYHSAVDPLGSPVAQSGPSYEDGAPDQTSLITTAPVTTSNEDKWSKFPSRSGSEHGDR
ncbi:uncharacterized protein MYCFIDRAFT_214296 [Pseudocercospora fijiensis CIRAD86]|uniref:C3H1-type domain-containing protein n=1 Tax=Pseudocercospora fijiensis (strain CIRAD86) TaxID=383855 RepID=M3APM7_PSEFD|nr:uncharacterized protein MYCFIDRAFT_214296 [Pseudocercospora fijiensis CIRAD86]EME86571.1 hypothetical protein MYCFIDRAFT_214296 [Pseudocercospora fijiensis CIRAD86]